jgi:threonine dehydrogenase-like Zn-dependent dehydrogenase
LLLTQLAADRGAHVVVLSRHPYELEIAESMEAEETIVAREDGSDAERALRVNGGAGFDRVIEVAGSQTDVDIAHRICAERGRLMICGWHGNRRVSMSRGKGPHGSAASVVNVSAQTHEHYAVGVRKAIQAALEGRLDPFPLMSHTVSMQSMDQGFRLTRQRPEGFVKALLLHET